MSEQMIKEVSDLSDETLLEESEDPIYYDIEDDFEKYPDAWCYIVMSKRGPGKSYSTLKSAITREKKFTYIRRTNKEIQLLVDGAEADIVEGTDDMDMSPFVPINRDLGTDIKPVKVFDGLAGFYDMAPFDGEKVPAKFIGYALSAALASQIKGADLSVSDWMIWDEFIENPWDIVKKSIGEAVLNIYETIKRDRKKRGRPELKLILLANAVKVDCIMFRTMGLVDIVAEMDINGQEYYYDEYKRLMIHIIDSDFDKTGDEEKDGIERTMEGTAWAASSYGAHFAYNDFTALGKQKLKGHKCIMHIIYKLRDYYVYKKGSMYFVTQIRGQTDKEYNLNRENQQKLFYEEIGVDLRHAAIEDRVIFSDYTAYDLIVNYKKNFKL